MSLRDVRNRNTDLIERGWPTRNNLWSPARLPKLKYYKHALSRTLLIGHKLTAIVVNGPRDGLGEIAAVGMKMHGVVAVRAKAQGGRSAGDRSAVS